jgi:hypothetical protein
VLFAEKDKLPPGQSAEPEPDLPPLSLPFDPGMAVVVDLPGPDSVRTGLLLARQGYRPVPLFNCGAHSAAVIDSRSILRLLEEGAGSLSSVGLGQEAPPAFLLDANRLHPSQPIGPGTYDNRWMVFPQDFPSASFLKSHGISCLLLLHKGERPQDDLAHVLLRWQEEGLDILAQNPAADTAPRSLQVAKPSGFRALSYRFRALWGLRRNSAGGFGSVIPIAAAGGTGFG